MVSGGPACSSKLSDQAYLVVVMSPSVGVNQIAKPGFWKGCVWLLP